MSLEELAKEVQELWNERVNPQSPLPLIQRHIEPAQVLRLNKMAKQRLQQLWIRRVGDKYMALRTDADAYLGSLSKSRKLNLTLHVLYDTGINSVYDKRRDLFISMFDNRIANKNAYPLLSIGQMIEILDAHNIVYDIQVSKDLCARLWKVLVMNLLTD